MKFRNLFKKGSFLRRFGLALIAIEIFVAFFAFSGGKLRAKPVEKKIEITAEEQHQAVVIDALLENIKKRLVLSEQIASWNWDHTAPIDQPEKELALLKSLSQASADKGVDLLLAEDIIQAQIDAEKIVQIKAFEQFAAENRPINHGNDELTAVKELDQLNAEFVDQVAALAPLMKKNNLSTLLDARAKVIFTGTNITFSAKERAIAPFIQ